MDGGKPKKPQQRLWEEVIARYLVVKILFQRHLRLHHLLLRSPKETKRMKHKHGCTTKDNNRLLNFVYKYIKFKSN